MKMPDFYRYHAIFTYEDDGVHVVIPDLPGCITFGKDEEEAIRMAKEAVSLHIYGMEQDKEPIPEPSSMKSWQKRKHWSRMNHSILSRPLCHHSVKSKTSGS